MKKPLLADLVPMDEVKDVVRHLIRKGITGEALIEEAVAFADKLVDWGSIFEKWLGKPGKAMGDALDAVDRPLVLAVVKAIVAAVQKA